jgi:hypothetical protein
MQLDTVNYIGIPTKSASYFADRYERYDKFNSNYQVPAIGYEIPKPKIIKEKISVPDMSFLLLNEKFCIPSPLNDIVDEIIDSQDILTLENNWDMNGAEVIQSSLYLEAVKFLLLYSKYIFKELNTIIKAPEINPCRNGSVDFSWRTDSARMLINVRNKNETTRATFYGFLKSNNLPFEGLIDMVKIDKNKAEWMKNLK